ncbi:integrase arm-type DNA-binding domain-containing protein [Salipiger sp. 1_MG-2023]|uniref:tyrosine-type recombinase/integrase n=1 Tax=Salipiger sp. 1_MG-2023 TaxID=3062665 RepID=UPI0026E45628|nr:site-specific integrase [Salipiger sp. 1_MG-2023]MDO6587141.1 integrase arm-type DNA-binding domain-containing protein [Salipiger sp. 1_MG-2023]MDO6587148.1 integrase arm-type DNA-binding domain-containing protein [Salipiger sp. 1_MG-2023]
MPRPLNKLSAAAVKSATPGKYSDGGGLWFHKRDDGGAQWFLRITAHGRRREMGLGRYPDVTLKDARKLAERWRADAVRGLDPIKERERKRREQARNLHLLKDIALDAFESRKADLKGDGKAGRWFSPLELHVLPKLGKVPVADLDQTDIRDTLAPIWHVKADTARKAMNRLSICMRHAAALGLDVDLQATDKARALLGKQRHKAQNIPALPWQDVPAFYQSLTDGSITTLALRFLILTAVRSYPVRFLNVDQIDGDIWTVPAEAMKGRRDATTDFRVPLSSEALAVIEQARPFAREGFLFPGVRKGVISDMTMSKFMERRGMAERPHGFRSSFRDWLAEATNAPHEVAETCLGHTVGGAVERAYRRTDFLDQRATLMQRWSRFLVSA